MRSVELVFLTHEALSFGGGTLSFFFSFSSLLIIITRWTCTENAIEEQREIVTRKDPNTIVVIHRPFWTKFLRKTHLPICFCAAFRCFVNFYCLFFFLSQVILSYYVPLLAFFTVFYPLPQPWSSLTLTSFFPHPLSPSPFFFSSDLLPLDFFFFFSCRALCFQ